MLNYVAYSHRLTDQRLHILRRTFSVIGTALVQQMCNCNVPKKSLSISKHYIFCYLLEYEGSKSDRNAYLLDSQVTISLFSAVKYSMVP